MKNQRFHVYLVSPAGYVHSNALYEVAELIFFGLKRIGFDVSFSRNQPCENATNIVIGGHLMTVSQLCNMHKGSIYFNSEQLGAENFDWTSRIKLISEENIIWDYSERNIDYLFSLGISGRRLTLGYAPELCRLNASHDKPIDVLFYGCINDRRKIMLDRLSNIGLRVKALFGIYGHARDRYIEKSKIVLNLHYYESKIFESVRVFYLLSNSVPVVAEVGEGTSSDRPLSDGVLAVPYDSICDEIISLVNCPESLRMLGRRGQACIRSVPVTEELRKVVC